MRYKLHDISYESRTRAEIEGDRDSTAHGWLEGRRARSGCWALRGTRGVRGIVGAPRAKLQEDDRPTLYVQMSSRGPPALSSVTLKPRRTHSAVNFSATNTHSVGTPRNIREAPAAVPRRVSSEYPCGGVAATQPRTIQAAAAAVPRAASTDDVRGAGGVSRRGDDRVDARARAPMPASASAALLASRARRRGRCDRRVARSGG